MFQKVLFGIGLALAIANYSNAAAPCKDIETVWTLSSTFVDSVTPTRIYSDGSSYANGANGISALIKSCSSGTNDAVLSVTSNRVVMFNFAGAFLGTSYSAPPAWANSGPFASAPTNAKNCTGGPCTLLNIGNILDSGTVDRNQYYILYRRLHSGFVAPDKNFYHLTMQNPATTGVTPDATANSPYLNSRVIVEHYPATSTQKEKWIVYPELPSSSGSQSPSPENGVLFSNDKTVNYGQFSMPFLFTIEVK
jgi:hypothetical protein